MRSKSVPIQRLQCALIWHYVVSVKSKVKISSIFVAFLENMNFSFRKQLLFWWNSPHVLLKFNNFSEIWSFNISLYSFSENIPFWPWTKNKNVALGLVTYVTLEFFETLIAENSHCIKFYILFSQTTINASYAYKSGNLRGNFPLLQFFQRLT